VERPTFLKNHGHVLVRPTTIIGIEDVADLKKDLARASERGIDLARGPGKRDLISGDRRPDLPLTGSGATSGRACRDTQSRGTEGRAPKAEAPVAKGDRKSTDVIRPGTDFASG
jgi:hypothetical protein